MTTPEKSKYFVDSHGVLVFDQWMSLDTRMRYKISGVFPWKAIDNSNPFMLKEVDMVGFIAEKYRKFIKTK